jgi:hypothetical protein
MVFSTSDIGFLIYGVNVQVPTSLGVLSYLNISLVSAGCLATDYGMGIAITYQVLDQKGSPLQSATMEPQEKILNDVINGDNFGNTVPNWVDIYNKYYPGSTKFTTSSGQFLDAPFRHLCSRAIYRDFHATNFNALEWDQLHSENKQLEDGNDGARWARYNE